MSKGLGRASSRRHIVIFEPATEGHHLSWLRYIAEDMLTAGFQLTLALDGRPEARKLIEDNLSSVIPDVSRISVFDETGNLHGGSKLNALATCLNNSGADEIFVNNLDYAISVCLRKAAIGIYPPKPLRGRLSGVYFRPRFLANATWPPGNVIKAAGFERLCRNLWFNNIYFMDENLCRAAEQHYAGSAFHVLPDPWDGDYSLNQREARKALGIPTDKFVLLNYGIGDRRKGLHLTVRAMRELPPASQVYLLCAGKIAKDRSLVKELAYLEELGMAKILDRYVSDAEQTECFCASDVVLLPYINHFGSSGVLSLSAAAGRMVIASDDGLVGRLVREHTLGLLFPSGSVEELKKCMTAAASLSASDKRRYEKAARDYAHRCSREAFRKALLAPLMDVPQKIL